MTYQPTEVEGLDAAEAPLYSTNDSHMHYDIEAKKRREKLGIELKPGNNDWVDAEGPKHLCKRCNEASVAAGEGPLPPPERPSNRTYDRSAEIKKANEFEDMKRQLAELQEEKAAREAAQKGGKVNTPTFPSGPKGS